MEKGDWKSALTYFELALKYVPNASTYFSASCVAWNAGDYERSAEHAREALRLDPESVDAQFGVGLCEEQLGNLDDAVLAFRRTTALRSSHAEAWAHLGDVYLKQGNVGESEAAYRQGVTKVRRNFVCMMKLGKLLLNSGRTKESQALFSRVAVDGAADNSLRLEAQSLLRSSENSSRR